MEKINLRKVKYVAYEKTLKFAVGSLTKYQITDLNPLRAYRPTPLPITIYKWQLSSLSLKNIANSRNCYNRTTLHPARGVYSHQFH